MLEINKSSNDKWDCHSPNKPYFMHTQWHVSKRSIRFHMGGGYGWSGESQGFAMGPNKLLTKASGYGINMDGDSVGKSNAN
jgi:hypothetical protein